MNPDNSETITKDELIRRLRERAERAEKESEELRRKWEQRHMDLEIVAAYDSGKASGEKECDELAAQVVALKEANDTIRHHLERYLFPMCHETVGGPPEKRERMQSEFNNFMGEYMALTNLHPAAVRLMERLRLLEELRQMVEDFDNWTETATNLRKEVFCHDPEELDKLKAKAVEAARGKR